jgi:RNA polymerase sigma factor (TIGR02999 family)
VPIPAPEDPLATLVARAEAGDVNARDQLFTTLYEELHGLARREVRRQGAESPLGVTTLLHEAYLAFGARDDLAFPDKSRFLAYAARAMRGVIIDRVRSANAAKRGGGQRDSTLDTQNAQLVGNHEELLEVHEALEDLAQLDPLLARVVDLRFFCGFTFAEIAAVHGVSERTVQRHWEKARLMLRHAMRPVREAAGDPKADTPGAAPA